MFIIYMYVYSFQIPIIQFVEYCHPSRAMEIYGNPEAQWVYEGTIKIIKNTGLMIFQDVPMG